MKILFDLVHAASFKRHGKQMGIGAVFLAGAAFQLVLLPLPGYVYDVNTFERWELALIRHGTHGIYHDPSLHAPVTYGPVALYFFWAIGALHDVLIPTSPVGSFIFRLITKAPAALADLVLAWLLYRIAWRLKGEGPARIVAHVVLFAPPFWLATAYWGQIDSLQTAFIAAALALALEERVIWAWVALAASVLIKPQGLLMAPVLAIWLASQRGPRALPALAAGCVASLALTYVTALPFVSGLNPITVFREIAGAYSRVFSPSGGASVSAFNLYTITLPEMASEKLTIAGQTLHTWGLILTVATLLFVYACAGRTRSTLVLSATAALAAPYFLATQMHERYLYPALAVGLLAGLLGRSVALIMVPLAIVFTIDLVFALVGIHPVGANHPFLFSLVRVLSALNIALFAALLLRCLIRARSVESG